MDEYIERDALIDDLDAAAKHGGMGAIIAQTLQRYVKRAPAADVAPVRHGRWVLGNVEPGYFTPGGNRPWICSDCGWLASYMLGKPKENYCPNCGAKMDGAGNGEEED